ncbi:hypothetical protein LTR47_002968 [Exophiala xenobiotica]|nr:hypothetical protein LTR47_002968 [Exophiala xenobiotica]KAK5255235.1 hypothetical protein LTS06_000648 [Exophiala xenobiotica]KAK5351445.1 hypothetical protein LTR61_004795 [Exophiala xenobiotica]KAK5376025.1 hypothetical protein LTS13_004823 [Exophiala xenobiotica]KAK5383623.1 hypothetical protein LTR11_002632 [Exophiala xenobiotica]
MADQTSSSSPSSSLSNLIRLAPLQVSDLPGHPDLPGSGSSADLSALVTALLDDGASFLSPSTFGRNFKHHSTKPSPPSAARVEVLNHTVPANAIAQVQWTRGSSSHHSDINSNNNNNNSNSNSGGGGVGVSRSKPLLKTGDEHWFARRSVHRDVSSKNKDTPGHASWDEFVFGLRDEHSKHEMEFTPTLYDARPVADWKGQIHKMEEEGKGGGFGFKGKEARYTNVSLGVYEMCHAIPPPLMPRCFCVLVATASITGERGEDEFIAVTVPVDLTGGATTAAVSAGAGTRTGTNGESEKSVGFYSTGRNMREGEDAQRRKKVLMGLYTAVEVVRRRRDRDSGSREIEWIMATASDAKGNLPMWLQKMSLPGAIAKDVGFFLKWIKDVDVDGGEATMATATATATATTRRG